MTPRMDTDGQTAVLLRRLLHALGLIVDKPGQWNPDGNLDDNWPSRATLCTSDPGAFGGALADLTGGEASPSGWPVGR
jgi:hypothetical protein